MGSKLSRLMILCLCLILALSAGATAEYKKLQRGDSGAEVLEMQNALKSLGYPIKCDGKYGADTYKTVKQFQTDQGLAADGVAGKKTLERLYSLTGAASPTPVPGGNGSYAKLQYGSSGAEVKALQEALIRLGFAVTANGRYDDATRAAVIVFQRNQGLSADGVAGNDTLTRLYAVAGAPTEIPAVTAAPTFPPASYSGTATVKGGSLNLRSGPGTGNSVITSLPDRAAVQVLEKGADWCRVRYGNLEGWCMTAFLIFQSGATAAPTKIPAVTAAPTLPPVSYSGTATVKGGSLNLRSGPGTGNSVITSLPDRAAVQVLEKGADWCRVRYGNLEGWCMTAFLSFASGATAAPTKTPAVTAAPAVPPAFTSGTATVKGGSLNLRNAPATGNNVIMALPNHAVVQVLERGSVWCRVRYDGEEGWCMAAFLIFEGAAEPTKAPVITAAPTAPAVSGVKATVIGGSLNLRSAASTAGRVLAVMPDGSETVVVGYGPEWSQIRYGSVTGYAMTRFLRLSTVTAVPTGVPTPTPGPGIPPSVTAAPYDTGLFTRTLRKGYTGQDVTALQQRLRSLNYLTSVTGTYDDATMAAVKLFQSLHGLTDDGLAGDKTFAALFSSAATPYTLTVSNYKTLRIYYGSQDASLKPAIQKMQERLQALGYTVKVNGTFDETTYMAVLAFQLRNGLTVNGSATPAMQTQLYSSAAKGADAPASVTLEANAGEMSLPDKSGIGLLHWFNTVRPMLTTGKTLTIADPATHVRFQLRVLSSGRHADSEPLTLRDTLLMFKAFGNPSWNIHPVYVLLPDGSWTMATMHNRPHLTGSINANGFDGHLCVHFLRDMDECRQNDPDYGVSNQKTLREAWRSLTGETVN